MGPSEEDPLIASDVEPDDSGYGTVVKRRPRSDDVWRRRESNAAVRVLQVVTFDDLDDEDRDCVVYEVLNPAKGERRVGGCEIKHMRRAFWFRGEYDPDLDYSVVFNRLEDLIEGWTYELDRRRFELKRVRELIALGVNVADNEARVPEREADVVEAQRLLELAQKAYEQSLERTSGDVA